MPQNLPEKAAALERLVASAFSRRSHQPGRPLRSLTDTQRERGNPLKLALVKTEFFQSIFNSGLPTMRILLSRIARPFSE